MELKKATVDIDKFLSNTKEEVLSISEFKKLHLYLYETTSIIKELIVESEKIQEGVE
jgi:hypothetical protein